MNRPLVAVNRFREEFYYSATLDRFAGPYVFYGLYQRNFVFFNDDLPGVFFILDPSATIVSCGDFCGT